LSFLKSNIEKNITNFNL